MQDAIPPCCLPAVPAQSLCSEFEAGIQPNPTHSSAVALSPVIL